MWTKSGQERGYESVLLRRTYRDGGKVKHETLANLSKLPDDGGRRDRGDAEGPDAGAGRRASSPSPGRCRTGMWRRSRRWRTSWGCPRCWGRRAGRGIWCWR